MVSWKAQNVWRCVGGGVGEGVDEGTGLLGGTRLLGGTGLLLCGGSTQWGVFPVCVTHIQLPTVIN